MKNLILSKSSYYPTPFLAVPLLIAAALFSGLFAATSSASDIAVYQWTISGRQTTYEENLNGPAEAARVIESAVIRFLLIYHIPDGTYRAVRYFTNVTPEGRRKVYQPAPFDQQFNANFATNGATRRNDLVLSIFGIGVGPSAGESGNRKYTTIETIAGRIRNQRIRTTFDGVLEMALPSTLSGPYASESMEASAEKNRREIAVGNSRMRLNKRLTSGVFALDTSEAQAAVELYLQAKGYEPQ